MGDYDVNFRLNVEEAALPIAKILFWNFWTFWIRDYESGGYFSCWSIIEVVNENSSAYKVQNIASFWGVEP